MLQSGPGGSQRPRHRRHIQLGLGRANSRRPYACSANASAERPETNHGNGPCTTNSPTPADSPTPAAWSVPAAWSTPADWSVPAGLSVPADWWVGSSMTMWALVPLMPKAEMPARRGCVWGCHGCASVSSSTAPAVQSTCVVGSSMCSVAGRRSWRIAMTILMIPATPAAAWVCPMFDLMEPNHNGWPHRGPDRRSLTTPVPRWVAERVPVPCASTTSTSDGCSPALANA